MKLILLSLCLEVTLAVAAQNTQLNLASDIWPPFTNVANEKSFAIDLVKGALIRMDISIDSHITNFDEVLSGLKEGKYEGSAALWQSPEREEYLFFSDPYLQNQLVLVGKKGSDVSAGSIADLKGKRIAVVGAYAYGDSLHTGGITLITGESDQQNLERLLKDEADYMLVDALLIQYLIKHQIDEVQKYLEIGHQPLLIKSLHFALRKDVPNAVDIIKGFNNEIIKMMVDGTYHRILELNWIRADINGDGQTELVLSGNQAGTKAPTNNYDVYFQQSSINNNAGGYYIGGNFYKSWDKIPDEYKTSPMKAEDLSKIGAFNFRF